MLVHTRLSITGHNPQRVAVRKNTRWGAILVVMATLVSAFAVAAQAGVVRPPAAGPRATTLAPVPTYVGPTPDLTAVANAISSSHKSLEIVVTVKPGLALTSSVTISIRFTNSAGVFKVITQCYVASTGNRFVFHDIEGDGKPRGNVRMQATLSQDKFRLGDAAGPSFTMPWSLDLDPLYDVTISALQFKLNNDCDKVWTPFGDIVHDSEIHFVFHSPDWVLQTPPSFPMRKGWTRTITEFAWARTEVSQSARLHWPNYWFWEHDPELGYARITGGQDLPTGPDLVPGSTGWVGRTLKDIQGQNCEADISFTITYHLRKYANDSPGGTGCFPSAIQR